MIICLDKKIYIPEDENEVKDVNINELYNILNLDISEIPTKEKLRKSYFKISAKVHPDKHPDEVEKYTAIFSKVNDAYHSLLNYYYPKKNPN